ncbi:hypothetical protein HY989_03935 [Candidatus Micrarchaeota archaeon]|nr:hypothetical protein [Candidatus Micrarchaeota archaeon]
MLPRMDPRQMASMMRQFGIKNDEIKTKRVIIEKSDGKRIIVEPANVLAIDMQGDKSFQVSGPFRETSGGGSLDESPSKEQQTIEEQSSEEEPSEAEAESGAITEEDIAMVAQQGKVSSSRAKELLDETNGDIAEAILRALK